MKIYLIGMPLSGKTTTAIKLAEKLKLKSLDLDIFIEETFNVSIDELFKNHQEAYFRSLETKALNLLKDSDNIIISTGGGIILNPDHKDLMDGVVIYLDISLDILESRQIKSYDRPLIKSDGLKKLYKERKNLYDGFASITITDTDLNHVVDNILRKLKEEGFL